MVYIDINILSDKIEFSIFRNFSNNKKILKRNEIIFPITERAVQKQLKIVTDWLELDSISTHSFRKFFATQVYQNNDYNIILVQQLLQHSSPAVTQRYIGVSSKDIETALSKHKFLK